MPIEVNCLGESIQSWYEDTLIPDRLLLDNSVLFDAVKLEFELRHIRDNPREEDITRFYTAQVSRRHE
jgi:hypothetical protein